MIKKTVSVGILAASLVVSSLGTSMAGSKQKSYFNDTYSHWATGVIERYAEMGVVKGVGNGVFKPDVETTRAEFFAMLHRGLGIQLQYFAAPDIAKIYKDTKNDDWYADIAYDLYSSGIIDDKDSLRPNEQLTREEMAHYAVNAYTHIKSGVDEVIDQEHNIVPDINTAASKYVNEIYYAYGLKIVGGKEGGAFDPKGISTRAEGLVVVNNLLNALGYNNIEPLKVEPAYTLDGSGLTMTLKVSNQGSTPMKIQYTSGQKYDFELLDESKNVIYKWSEGRMFTEAIENQEIKKADSVELSEKLDYKGNESTVDAAKYLVCYFKGSIEGQTISPSGYMIEINKAPAPVSDFRGESEPTKEDGAQ